VRSATPTNSSSPSGVKEIPLISPKMSICAGVCVSQGKQGLVMYRLRAISTTDRGGTRRAESSPRTPTQLMSRRQSCAGRGGALTWLAQAYAHPSVSRIHTLRRELFQEFVHKANDWGCRSVTTKEKGYRCTERKCRSVTTNVRI